MCWRGFSEGRGCPSLLLLLSGSGFMLLLLLSAGEVSYERRLIEGKLCVCVRLGWCVRRFVQMQCMRGFFSGCARKVAELISDCFSCRHEMTVAAATGRLTCCNPLTLSSLLVFLLLSLFSPFMHLSLHVFISSLFPCFPLTSPYRRRRLRQQGAFFGRNDIKTWWLQLHNRGWWLSCVFMRLCVYRACANSLCLSVCVNPAPTFCVYNKVWANETV